MEKCRFCELIMRSRSTDTSIYDRVVQETQYFVVVPALGSLVSGYLMIISKRHIPAMAYLSNDEWIELLFLINNWEHCLNRCYNLPIIIFEHGSAHKCFHKAANSIDHAHMHLVPVNITQEERILADACAVEIHDLRDIENYRGNPYILYRNAKGIHFASKKEVLPSQYMRRWIAKEVGLSEEWDWKQFEKKDNMYQTVSDLLEIQRNEDTDEKKW